MAKTISLPSIDTSLTSSTNFFIELNRVVELLECGNNFQGKDSFVSFIFPPTNIEFGAQQVTRDHKYSIKSY